MIFANVVVLGLFIPEALSDVFRIGYISGSKKIKHASAYGRPGYQISGAISLAVNQINEHHPDGLLIGHSLDFEYAETFGVEENSIQHTARFGVENYSVIIGPQETCNHEAHLASVFNKLMLSYFCPNSLKDSHNFEQFSTFVSVKPPIAQVAKPLASLLLKYGWRKVTFLYNSGSLFEARVCQTIQNQLVLEGLQVLQTETWNVTYFAGMESHFPSPFKKIVRRTKDLTRIYVIVGTLEEQLGFMEAMQQAQLLTQGIYFVVGVYLEQYRAKDPAKYLLGTFSEKVKPELVSAFQSFLGIIASPPKTANLEDFTKNVNFHAELPPFSFTWDPSIPRFVRIEAAYLHDAVMLYAHALDTCLRNRTACPDPHDGQRLLDYFLDRSYQSAMGYDAYIDRTGVAQGNYSLLALRNSFVGDQEQFGLLDVGVFLIGRDRSGLPELVLKQKEEIGWNHQNFPPVDEPACGFHKEKCPWSWSLIGGIAAGFVVVTVVVILGCRQIMYEQQLERLLWKIEWKDLNVENVKACLNSKQSVQNMQSLSSSNLDFDVVELRSLNLNLNVEVGFYKEHVVAVKRFRGNRFLILTRDIKLELKQMSELAHPNLCGFIGACTEPACLVMEFCQRGSLSDILYGQPFAFLDKSFTCSFIVDIIKGMIYLHSSPLQIHGNLMPANLLVDSKFVVKIANYGLSGYKRRFSVNCKKSTDQLFWTAPELLRMETPLPQGTQAADAYAFGLILYEISSRHSPFHELEQLPQEIVARLRCPVGGNLLRPNTEDLPEIPSFVIHLMEECWNECPHARPCFTSIMERLKALRKEMKPNILDNMVYLLQKYANNLENEVAERTKELEEEKQKTESLLYEMLPRPVAERLLTGKNVEAEHFDSVTIFFSDIVGFTSLSAGSTAFEVVEFLNDLYTLFDKLLELYNAYKVETIGDSYMMVSGLPIKNANHAGVIATMALHLLEAIKCFRIRHRPSQRLLLRIGIHSGPVVAGIVGIKMPRFCLFGDTVNTASRYESTGKPLKIHCSAQCKSLLDSLGGFHLETRGHVSMKGKGEQLTYWLTGTDAVVPRRLHLRSISSMNDLSSSVPRLSSTTIPSQPNLLRRWSNTRHPPQLLQHMWRRKKSSVKSQLQKTCDRNPSITVTCEDVAKDDQQESTSQNSPLLHVA